jgi:DNA-directed RNA polymerase specialized sigma24 family protein
MHESRHQAARKLSDTRAVEYLVTDSSCYADPESNLAREQIVDVLLFELSRLPRFLRIPLTSYYLDGLTLDSVAGRLGITVMAVRSRLHRGRNCLMKRMMWHCNQRSGVRLFVQN